MKDTLAAAILHLVFIAGMGSAPALGEEGMAVHYSDKLQGKPTANGEVFNQHAMTAAHQELAFGSRVRVTNLENGKSVVVTVNDRMANHSSHRIDVTRRAAQELGFERQGTARVNIEPDTSESTAISENP